MVALMSRRGFWKRSKPTITWYKDGKILLETERYVISNGQLKIQNLIDNDNGDYKCLAENPAGSQEYKTTLEVNSPPSIALGSQSISSLVNERVTLECQGEFKIFLSRYVIVSNYVITSFNNVILPYFVIRSDNYVINLSDIIRSWNYVIVLYYVIIWRYSSELLHNSFVMLYFVRQLRNQSVILWYRYVIVPCDGIPNNDVMNVQTLSFLFNVTWKLSKVENWTLKK